MPHSVAIVGSGPSGFYALDGLSRALPGVRIDLIDRLPTPFGLVRLGVAPDHQGTKAVARQFDRLARKPGIRFVGNVEIGRDVSLAELRALYDAVVIATGAPRDRRLGIPGEDLLGVHGSWPVVGWYNGHPDFAGLDFRLPGPAVAIIGNGNVAIDLARVLARTPQEMKGSDLAPHAAAVIAGAGLRDIHLIGRRGPVEASFTSAELAELGQLERVVPVIEGAEVPSASGAADPAVAKVKDRNLEILRGFAANVPGSKPITLHLVFNTTPVAFEGTGALERIALRQSDGERRWSIEAQTAITAIGYRGLRLDDAPFDEERGVFAADNGVVAPGLYAVGWAKRGPSGVIATNRPDSLAVAERIAADLRDREGDGEGPAGLDRLLESRGVAAVDFAGWLRIEQMETEAGKAQGRPRIKLATMAQLLAASRG